MKYKKPLYYISLYAEKLCCWFHWLNPLTDKLGLGWCHLSNFSIWLDEKYDLGVWKDVPIYKENQPAQDTGEQPAP